MTRNQTQKHGLLNDYTFLSNDTLPVLSMTPWKWGNISTYTYISIFTHVNKDICHSLLSQLSTAYPIAGSNGPVPWNSQVNLPSVIPTSALCSALQFQAWLFHFQSSFLGRHWRMALLVMWRTMAEFPALAWPRSDCCGHLEKKQLGQGICLTVSLSVALKKKEENE